jgi:hypothetical protein
MFKKIITSIAIVAVTWAISFASYTAVVDNKTELESANSLAEQGIINNHVNDPENYNLNDNVLRQEIAAVARWVAWLAKKGRCDNEFKDLSDTNPNTWACRNVEVLIDNDLIAKNDYFRPEDKITKSETIAMLIKSIWFDYSYDSSSDKNWQEQIVEYAASKGVVELFTDYNTDATRGWVFQVADTTIRKDKEIKAQMKQKEDKLYTDEAM